MTIPLMEEIDSIYSFKRPFAGFSFGEFLFLSSGMTGVSLFVDRDENGGNVYTVCRDYRTVIIVDDTIATAYVTKDYAAYTVDLEIYLLEMNEDALDRQLLSIRVLDDYQFWCKLEEYKAERNKLCLLE